MQEPVVSIDKTSKKNKINTKIFMAKLQVLLVNF